MTAILILTVLLLLAVAGPLLGVDSRSRGGWTANDPGQPLWSDAGTRSLR